MVLHDAWFPNRETFQILFPMIAYGNNPGPDAERLRAKLETCRFISSILPTSKSSNNSAEQFDFGSSAPYPYSPVNASMYALNAWLQTVNNNGGIIPPGQPDPAERAWAILQALRVGSTPLFLPVDDNEKAISSRGSLYDPGHAPNDELYTLALKVCSRAKSPQSLDIALDIFDAVQKEGLLLEGNICRCLLGVFTHLSNSNSDILNRRIEATKNLYLAVAEQNPKFEESKQPAILRIIKKHCSYVRIRYPELYEIHLAELGLIEESSSSGSSTTESDEDSDDDDDDDDNDLDEISTKL